MLVAAALMILSSAPEALDVEVLESKGGIPAHIAGRFREPVGFQQSASGQYFVFDRRAHAVYGVDEGETASWEILQIGGEPGRLLGPSAFSIAPDGTFVVADAPEGRERIQVFTPAGFRTGGFLLPTRTRPRIVFQTFVLNGIGSLQYTGNAILLSQPEHGGLITQYALDGRIDRTFGALRTTGHEADPEVHLALNSGIPLVDPTGGFWFVFQAGMPVFRRYDAAGHLLFERTVQGREIDGFVSHLPTHWPTRGTADGELPLVTPTIRTAAVDPAGRLWIVFTEPYCYVFDRDGDRIRTLQFRAAGIVAPNSLFFSRRGSVLITPGLYEFDADGR